MPGLESKEATYRYRVKDPSLFIGGESPRMVTERKSHNIRR